MGTLAWFYMFRYELRNFPSSDWTGKTAPEWFQELREEAAQLMNKKYV